MRTALATLSEPAPPPADAAATSTLDTLVVVGNGMIGHRLCRVLVDRSATSRYRVVVFGEEPQPAYDRVRLSDCMTDGDEAGLLLDSAAWYADHGIELHLADPVAEIDRERRLVRAASGYQVRYRTLVLATGSAPHVPPIDGIDRPGVIRFRTLADLQALRARTAVGRSAAVIGGGLLGLEAARALQQRGLDVSVLEAAASLMPTQLDQQGGKELERQITALGIAVRTAAMTKRITASGDRHTLHLVGGDRLTVDVVVVAAGIRPRTELAAACGLLRCPQGGVVVDDRLRTSDPHVYAIGECASHRARIHGLVAPGYEMARALAVNLTGGTARFSGRPPQTRLKLLGVDVACAGETLDRGTTRRFHDQRGYRLVRVARGRLVGALGVGPWPEFSRIQEAIARRRRVWPWEMARFERTGRLWTLSTALPVTDWPAGAIVCQCLAITRGQVAAACARRPATVSMIAAATGASTACGSCEPLLRELAGEPAPPVPRGGAGLLVPSLAALVIAILLVSVAPYAFSRSVETAPSIEVLWRTGLYRQVTGFGLLALSLAASLLSVRKRWRRLTLGSFPAWRVLHVVTGLLTLVVLAIHTGGKLGANLNLALSLTFVTLNVVGAAAGGVTALEQALGRHLGRRLRPTLVLAHAVALWPMPTLLAFHIAAAYYF